jgi:hypothetical protein
MTQPRRSISSQLSERGRRILAAAIVVTVAACASEVIPDTATMPFGALNTNGDIDLRSLDIAAYDFAHPIKGDPAQTAEAIAAVDYMGGKLNTSPRWVIMPSLYRAEMLQSRGIMRQFVGSARRHHPRRRWTRRWRLLKPIERRIRMRCSGCWPRRSSPYLRTKWRRVSTTFL